MTSKDQVRRLYHPTGPDRVAVVSAEPAHHQKGQFLVRLARGPKATSLAGGGVYGPFSEDEAAAHMEELANALLAEGFLEAGAAEIVEGLSAADSKTRAQAALRAGWRQYEPAVPRLIELLDSAIDELCSVIDSLGKMGSDVVSRHPAVLPALRTLAQRKLLSRRRSAVEALRVLEDSIGLADAHQRALGELPEPLAQAVQQNHRNSHPISEALEQAQSKRLGLYLDTLYEIGTPATVQAVRRRLASLHFAEPYIWRYVKSIFKRSMLRHDFETFGWLARQIELQGSRPVVVKAIVKSGYDGASRETRVFSRRTAAHVKRSAWRYLRQLAHHRPYWYTTAAAEAVAAYHPADAMPPIGLQGQFGHCYLLQQILYASGRRLELNYHRLVFRYRSAQHIAVPAGAREEAFSQLWDEYPQGYLRILARSDLHLALDFARQAIETRHPDLLSRADIELLVLMMGSAHIATVELAREELQRRFDPDNVSWDAVDALLSMESPSGAAAELGREWLEETVSLWAGDANRAEAYLTHEDSQTMALAMSAMSRVLATDQALRDTTAAWIADWLRAPREPMDGVVHIARTAVLGELGRHVQGAEAMRWIRSEHPPLQAVGADLLADNAEARESLTIAEVGELANHELNAVRVAAQKILSERAKRSLRGLSTDGGQFLSELFTLADSPWEDTRAVALDLLRDSRDWSNARPEELIGFVDSLQSDVQDFAIGLIRQHSESLDVAGLLDKVVEHPHQRMRHFALELAQKFLPEGPASFQSLLPCIRATLLDPWPRKAAKELALTLLVQRSAQDEQQAALALRFLDCWVQVHGVQDFELALATMTQIQMAHPDLPSSLSLKTTEAGS